MNNVTRGGRAMFLLAPILTSLSGCAFHNPIMVWNLDLESLSPDQAQGAIAAAETWQEALAGHCPVRFRVTTRGSGVAAVTLKVGPLPPPYTGYTAGNTITIVPGADADTFRIIVMHELGHAMGLDHQPTGIMRDPPEDTVGPSDVEAYAARWCP